MKKLLAVLLLAAAPAAAQFTYPIQPSGGGAAFSGGTITAPILGATGCGAPPYSFSADPVMGMCYDLGTTSVRIVGGGAPRLEVGTIALQANRSIRGSTGATTSLMAFSFADDTDTGIALPAIGADQMDFRAGGSLRVSILSTSLTSTVPFLAPAGTAAAPSYSFSGDTNTGIFISAADTLNVSTGGTSRMSVSATSLTSTLPLFVPVGTGGAPTYSFSGDSDTGMHQLSANSLGFAVGTLGTTFFLNTTTVTSNFNPFQGPTLSASTPTYSFSNDPNTGIFQNGTDVVGISAGGTSRMSVSNAAVSLAVPLVTTSTVPTSPSCTGLGTGSAAMEAGSSSTAGTFVLSPTGAPASSGTCSATIAALGTNQPTCVAMAQNVAGSVWEVEPTFRGGSGLTTTLLSFAWDNNGTSLTAGGTYNLVYICIGK